MTISEKIHNVLKRGFDIERKGECKTTLGDVWLGLEWQIRQERVVCDSEL